MSKKDFIALADAIRFHNEFYNNTDVQTLTDAQIQTLASFCQTTNERFIRGRWIDYVFGKCGKNSGKVAA